MELKTPYYLIDEKKLLKNLERVKYVREQSGAKSVLALKCFSTWSVFDLMKQYMDGTTSSSLYEAKLGYEKFGKEVHAYSVAYSKEDINELKEFSTKIIFNSISQLKLFRDDVKGLKLGLRINPQHSYSDFDLADPARKYSRLGAKNYEDILEVADSLSGVMFHCNCENDNFEKFGEYLDVLSERYSKLLEKVEWVSLGGGIYFTKDEYPLDRFCERLAGFSKKHGVQLYLEPGETAITSSGYLVTKVLDITRNELDIAIVDSSIEAHMLDLLVYRADAKIEDSKNGKYKYMVAGKSCLAGDVFGIFNFKSPLQIDTIINISDAAGYTMVKKKLV